jgi:hypothetical protein
MDYIQPSEMEFDLPCQDCGCHAVFTAVAPAGHGDRPLFLRRGQWGTERAGLKAFYDSMPIL